MLQKIIPRNARSKRALKQREPQVIENVKKTLILRGTKCSNIVNLVLTDIKTLKRPFVTRFTKKNAIHPFEDVSSLEFFSEKNDASLLIYGHHSKKRPHCITLVRCFDYKVLDMLELLVSEPTFRTMNQFKNRKCTLGMKPLMCFSGTAFESPVHNQYTLAKSMLLDFFTGKDVTEIDVEGLQYMIHVSVGESIDSEPAPRIHFRTYLLRTKRGDHKLPKVEVEEMGPRIDFTIGRTKEADKHRMHEAMKKPKSQEPKSKKNISTDFVGDKIGRIHIGKQHLTNLQTRKMKGLKRHRDMVDEDIVATFKGNNDDGSLRNTKRASLNKPTVINGLLMD